MSKFQKMGIVTSAKKRILIRVEALQKYLDDERMSSSISQDLKVFLINSSFCRTISSAPPWTGTVRFIALDVMDVTDMVT